jgi:hypothetical protein
LRVNGRATVLADADYFDDMIVAGKHPILALEIAAQRRADGPGAAHRVEPRRAGKALQRREHPHPAVLSCLAAG